MLHISVFANLALPFTGAIWMDSMHAVCAQCMAAGTPLCIARNKCLSCPNWAKQLLAKISAG